MIVVMVMTMIIILLLLPLPLILLQLWWLHRIDIGNVAVVQRYTPRPSSGPPCARWASCNVYVGLCAKNQDCRGPRYRFRTEGKLSCLHFSTGFLVPCRKTFRRLLRWIITTSHTLSHHLWQASRAMNAL
jgi:hypothetical protein